MPLNPATVLDAAVALLDETGLDELSTRKLADRLGVRVGALYWHYANKQALLDAIAERILADAMAGVARAKAVCPIEAWQDDVICFAHAHRDAMLAHPDGARVIATMSAPGPVALEFIGQLIGALGAAGMPGPDAEACADVVTSYVNGFTIEEQARRTSVPRALRDTAFTTGLSVVVDGLAVRTTR
ncbi:TetR/AcrR family transcriptional regulator C-terminal domain-containing protein [Amycolatopsis sp. NPDC059021]|uniref:TetR/AcrR family transcriptional regulator C-terminal domain-containing protein n=1 Tax=Amycolatopsis sp. NPDC059021 TaxID=3346704 RepID=UPI003670700F